VEDLLKFDTALRSFKLLSRPYTGYFLNRFENAPSDSFAFPQKLYRFAGAAPGICAFVAMDFKESYTVIVLSNYDFPTGINIGKEILEMLEIQF
jgi:hypothetical protein